jgi:exosortase A
MRRGFPLTVLVLALASAALWPSLRSLVGYWEDTTNLTYTHGFMIAAICLWLVWRARGTLDGVPMQPRWPAVPVVLVLSATWYLAWIAGIEVGHQLVVPLLLLATVAAALGLAAARAVAFPVGYLYFAIPVWSLVNDRLQSLTTFGVGLLTGVTGLPAFVQGNHVHIPAGTFEIAGGCSGLHFFIVAIAIATLLGELDRDRLRTRVLLVVLAAIMAIVMNWFRVYGIILNGHLTDMNGFLVKVDHYYFGWALFGVMLLAFFWIARRVKPAPVAAAPPGGREVQPAGAPAPPIAADAIAAGVAGAGKTGAEASCAGLFFAITVSIAAVAAGPALAAVVEALPVGASAQPLVLPPGRGGWTGPVPADAKWRPAYSTADAAALAGYDQAGATVLAYVNRYDRQGQGHEIVAAGNGILGSSGWDTDDRRDASAGSGSAAIPYREISAAAPDGVRWVVGYFFVVGGRNFTSDLPSKLYYGVAAARGRPTSGVVAAAVRCAADCEAARATLGRFLGANAGSLASVIVEASTES